SYLFYIFSSSLCVLSTVHTSSYFFLLMIRHTQISTLFPYTTLFRSALGSQEGTGHSSAGRRSNSSFGPRQPILFESIYPEADRRSEEHTSELQSREKLVCRLLLEKKKTFNF